MADDGGGDDSQETQPHSAGHAQRRLLELQNTDAGAVVFVPADKDDHPGSSSCCSPTASTASAPGTTATRPEADTNANTSTSKTKNRAEAVDRISIQDAQAAVRWWQQPQQQQLQLGGRSGELRDVLLDLHFDRPSNTAFFKLHTKVRLKALRHSKTGVYLWIPAERVRSLVLDADGDADDDDNNNNNNNGLVNGSAVSLAFELDSPAVLVGPNVSLTPGSKADGSVLDSLRALAQASCFTVYLPRRGAPSKHLLQPLCRAVLSATARPTSMLHHADLLSLYGGRGGKVVLGDWDIISTRTRTRTRVAAAAAAAAAAASSSSSSSAAAASSSRRAKRAPPPAYDQLRLSPPPPFPRPPLLPSDNIKDTRDTGIGARPNPAGLHPGSLVPNKRRRRSSDPGSVTLVDHAGLKAELREQLRNEIRSELRDEIRSELRDELRTEMRTEIKAEMDRFRLECREDQGRLRGWVEDEFLRKQDMDGWAEDVVGRELNTAKGELRESVERHLDGMEIRVEDNLKVYVQDALTSSTLTFEFG